MACDRPDLAWKRSSSVKDAAPKAQERYAKADSVLPLFAEKPSVGQSDPMGSAAKAGADVVEVGDTVIVRFADDNRVRRFRLNSAIHDPGTGEVGDGQPIVQAPLGTGIEEELELDVDGKQRRVIVEKITKAA